MPDAICAPRVQELGEKIDGLNARREELSIDADEALYAPSEEELEILAADVRSIVERGDARQIKALLQAYVKCASPAATRSTPPSMFRRFAYRRVQWS